MADCPRCQKEFDPHGTGDSQYFLYECERPYNCLLDKAERKEVMQKDANLKATSGASAPTDIGDSQ